MNRLEQFEHVISGEKSPADYTVHLARISQAEREACAFFAPVHYEPGYAYPLLVWLHGPGDSERQLTRVVPNISMRNYVGAAPRGTNRRNDSSTYDWAQDPASQSEAEQRVLAAVDAARERFHVHPQRVFVVGYGSGGTTALRVALNHPQIFAGAASLVGPFPCGGSPLSRLSEVRNLPLLIAGGSESRWYPEAAMCRDLRLSYVAGLMLSARQYPVADQLDPMMLADVNRWIMQLVCPDSPATSQDDGRSFPG